MGALARLAATAALLMAIAAPCDASPPPALDYAALPTGTGLSLSPDGSAVAMIGSVNGKQVFVILHFDGSPPKVFSAGDWIPQSIEWKTPQLLLATARTLRRNADRHSEALVQNQLVLLNADGGRAHQADVSGYLVSRVPSDPSHILTEGAGLGNFVTSYNVDTGAKSLEQGSLSHVYNWLADPSGKIRGAEAEYSPGALDSDQHRHIHYLGRRTTDDSWHVVAIDPVDGKPGVEFVSLDVANPDRMFLTVDGPSGYRVIRPYSISTGQPDAPIAQAPNADVSPILSWQRLVGYKVEGTVETFHYIDTTWQHDAQAISRALDGGNIEILDRTADGRHVLAALHDGTMPLQYWLLDRTGPKTALKLILNERDGMPVSRVSEASWTTYTARDGLRISALLTLPPGHPSGPIPFVILPHGGPHARDEMRFDWMAQFIASRGYGVLQPEFRTSTGFGKAVYESGFQQWGKAVQDDIADGARAMIARHLADPGRVAIVGASFGGYSALEQAEREPNLYRAAAAFAPVTDLPKLVGGVKGFSRKDYYIEEAGASYDEIEAASPMRNAGRVQVPVLIVHGKRDFTVPIEQTELMVKALRDAGKQVTTVYLPDSDHYLSDTADRLAWLQALDPFLAANLGPAKRS